MKTWRPEDRSVPRLLRWKKNVGRTSYLQRCHWHHFQTSCILSRCTRIFCKITVLSHDGQKPYLSVLEVRQKLLTTPETEIISYPHKKSILLEVWNVSSPPSWRGRSESVSGTRRDRERSRDLAPSVVFVRTRVKGPAVRTRHRPKPSYYTIFG